MTTLREAAQQALEALEAGLDVSPILAGEAEEALRAALAQQEQEQEPVATVEIVVPKLESIVIKHIPGAPFPTVGSLLYTAPPRREWQGLTDQEVWDAVQHGVVGSIGLPSKAIAVARTIEAALKEKNA